MTAPQNLVQAAVNRLSARVGSVIADTAAGLTLMAQDAPARLQQELSLFWQEVELEAQRLERGAGESGPSPGTAAADPAADPQEQIDQLRAQVAALARRLESPIS